MILAQCPACGQDVDLGEKPSDDVAISCPKCKASLRVSFEVETGEWTLTEDEELKAHIGLSAGEMLTIFNKTYDNTWMRLREKLKNEEISDIIFQFTETVAICIRDAMTLTLHENNEKIYEKLLRQGAMKK